MYDAIVIGGGIVGASTAYHLVRAGTKTLLIDRMDAGRATDAGAGILSPETNTRDGEAWFNFALEAVDYYPTLIERLQTEQEGETGYARCGKLIVAVSEDEIDSFEQASQIIFDRQKRRGTPSPDDLHVVSASEAQTMFPPLAAVQGAIYYRNAARVNGRLLAGALRRAAEGYGLTVKQAGVRRLILQGDSVSGVEADGETIKAGRVTIAGGAWSREFGAQLGLQIPVEPQRGQIIHLGWSAPNVGDWPIVTAFRGHYIVTWPNNRMVVGATRETGSGFKPWATASGVREVLDEAIRVAPGLAEARVREIRVGLRPYTADLLPVMGKIPGVDNVYLATGHGPTGLQLGPYSGKIIAEMMLDRAIETDISVFQVMRFRDIARG